MTMLIPLLLDTSSLANAKQQELNNDHTKFDSTSIPLIQTMSAQLRELELPSSLEKRYLLKQAPSFVPPHEYVVFPVRMVQYDAQPTMFQQTPTNVNSTAVGSFVHIRAPQQPPDVVTLESHHRHNQQSGHGEAKEHSPMEWDGRSDDPSRSHVRQFDEPYSDAARRSIWLSGWTNRGFASTTDQNHATGMRVPVSAQFLAASSLISDQQRYETVVKQHQQQQQAKYNQDQNDNDTDLTNVTKDSDDDNGLITQSDLPSSPRRRDVSFRKNSLDESMSLPIMNTDGGEYGRSYDFRAPSRETGGDETPTYDLRDFPVEFYKAPTNQQERASPPTQISPPTSNGFQQQPNPVRQSLSDRRFLDDSDPYLPLKLEQEERDKYATQGMFSLYLINERKLSFPSLCRLTMHVLYHLETNRTTTSKQSPHGQYSSSRDPHGHRSPTRNTSGHRSPTRDTSSHRSPTRDPSGHRSPTREYRSHRSPTRERSSRRSPTRDRHGHRHHHDPHQPYFPQLQSAPSYYNQTQGPMPVQYSSSVRLPLLRLGGPSMMAPSVVTHARLAAPPPIAVYAPPPMPVSAPLHPPLPMLHMATQLPPPTSLSPQATPADRQKLYYVQNMMQQYAGNNRPRLQLLQMRAPPRTNNNTDFQVPMPAPNIVTTSTDTKVNTGIQAEVPRQDGFMIEPGLFQVRILLSILHYDIIVCL